MDVRLPDGTIVTNVPDNITKEQLLAKLEGTPSESVTDNKQPWTGTIPEGMDIRDVNISELSGEVPPGFVPEAPQGPQTFKERLFGKEGSPLMPGAEVAKLAYENPDIVAATAASVVAPPLAVPAAVSRIPALGRIVAQLFRNAPQVAAAGGGGAAGGAAKEALNDPEATLDSIIDQSVRSGKEMSLAEGFGKGAASLISKIAAPGAKMLTDQGKSLLNFAKQHGLPFRPSAASPSITAKVVEGATDSFLPGRIFKQFANKKISNVLATNTSDANNLIAEVSKVYNKNSPGLDSTVRSASKALQNALEDLSPRAEAKYGAFTKAIGGRDRWTDYPKLKAAFETIKTGENALAGGADEATTKFIDAFMQKYPAQASADDLYAQYKRLSKIRGADKRNLGLIRDAFKEEFNDLASSTGDDAIKLLKEANIEYGLGKRYIKDPRGVVQKIVEGKIPDHQVTVQLFRDSQYGTLKQLEARIPQETFRNLQRLNLETLLQNSSTKSDTFMSVLDGQKLLSWIDKNPKTFGLYPKETQEALKNLGLYAKLHRSEAIAGAKGFGEMIEQTAIRTGLGGGAMFAAGGAPGVVVGSVAAPAIAWSMMRPNSTINKWLVKGQVGPFAKGIGEGLKVGGKMVFQDSLDE